MSRLIWVKGREEVVELIDVSKEATQEDIDRLLLEDLPAGYMDVVGDLVSEGEVISDIDMSFARDLPITQMTLRAYSEEISEFIDKLLKTIRSLT